MGLWGTRNAGERRDVGRGELMLFSAPVFSTDIAALLGVESPTTCHVRKNSVISTPDGNSMIQEVKKLPRRGEEI